MWILSVVNWANTCPPSAHHHNKILKAAVQSNQFLLGLSRANLNGEAWYGVSGILACCSEYRLACEHQCHAKNARVIHGPCASPFLLFLACFGLLMGEGGKPPLCRFDGRGETFWHSFACPWSLHSELSRVAGFTTKESNTEVEIKQSSATKENKQKRNKRCIEKAAFD